MATDILNVLSIVGFIVACFGLLWLVGRFEPHWVAKDGLRFTARMSDDAQTKQRWHEVKVRLDGNMLIVSGRGRHARGFRGAWKIVCVAELANEKRRHYVVSHKDDPNDTALLRVPASSPCVESLDGLIIQR